MMQPPSINPFEDPNKYDASGMAISRQSQQQEDQHRQGGIQQQQQHPPTQQEWQPQQQQIMHGAQHHQQQIVVSSSQQYQQRQLQPQQQQIMCTSNQINGVHELQYQQLYYRQQQQQLLMDGGGYPASQIGTQLHFFTNQQQQIDQKQVKSQILFICLEARQWQGIVCDQYDGSFMYVRPGADPNSPDLTEGIDVVHSKFIYGGDNSRTISECYNGLFTFHVLGTELGRRYLRHSYSSSIGTDLKHDEQMLQQRTNHTAVLQELKQIIAEQKKNEHNKTDEPQQDRDSDTTSNSAKRQRLEQQPQQQEDESLSTAEQRRHELNAMQEMEKAESALEQSKQDLLDQQQLHEQKLANLSVLEHQKQQYDKPLHEIFARISMETSQAMDDSNNDKINQIASDTLSHLMSSISIGEEDALKVISVMFSKATKFQRTHVSGSINDVQSEERDVLVEKAKAEEECVRLSAEAEAKKERYKSIVKAKEECGKVVQAIKATQDRLAAEVKAKAEQERLSIVAQQIQDSDAKLQQMEATRARLRQRLQQLQQQKEKESSLQQQLAQERAEQMAKVNDMVDAIMAKPISELIKEGQPKEQSQNVTLSLRFVQIADDRYPLPETNRNEITNTLIQRLSSVVVDENNNVKGAFQLSFLKPRPDEPNFIKVYGIPHVRLPPVDDDLFSTNNPFVDQREFANQYQVTLSLLEEQVVSAIEQASSSDEPPIAALQQILNDAYHDNNTPSQGEQRQLFFFKGVVYFVWIDAPLEVLEMLKETCKDVYEDVMAVKIGESGEDLIRHLKKMKDLLTYLAGAKLCWIAIGIPFGLCSSRMVEQWIHFIKLELGKSGEWHSREVLSLKTIKHILERTGGKVICRGTVSHGGQSGDGIIRTGGQEDGPGWIYFFHQLFTEEELMELWKIYRKLSEGEGKAFIRFLLASKVGASRCDYMERLRKNFWAMVRGRGEFVAVKGFSEVFKQEARLHKCYEKLQVCGERFMLTDANGNSAIESLLKLLRNDHRYYIEKGKLHREQEKLNYMEEETTDWIRRDLITLVECVDMIMKGVVMQYHLH